MKAKQTISKTAKRGRPAGSKNAKKKTIKTKGIKKQKEIKVVALEGATKKRGRPAGSKNLKHKKVVKIKSTKKQKDIVLTKAIKGDLNIDIWKCNDDLFKIYAENKELLEKLSKALNSKICATYMSPTGKEFGWDVVFEKKDLGYVNKVCKRVEC